MQGLWAGSAALLFLIKKASWKYGNVQSPSLVSILAADFNKPEQVYMELYFPAVQNMITPTLICITVNCVLWFKHSNLETDSAALWWMKEGVGTFIVHPLRLATFYLGSLLEKQQGTCPAMHGAPSC